MSGFIEWGMGANIFPSLVSLSAVWLLASKQLQLFCFGVCCWCARIIDQGKYVTSWWFCIHILFECYLLGFSLVPMAMMTWMQFKCNQFLFASCHNVLWRWRPLDALMLTHSHKLCSLRDKLFQLFFLPHMVLVSCSNFICLRTNYIFHCRCFGVNVETC